MKVLVTGASGFLGGRLAEALVRRGESVRVLRRPESSLTALAGLDVEHAIGDILDEESVARAVRGCDVVFHVAGLSSYWRARRDQVYSVNVDGTRTVMEACLRAGVGRVVHTSSVAAIGLASNGRPADEETPFTPNAGAFAYAHSKHLAEEHVRSAVTRGLQAVIVNPAVVMGAGDHYMISGSMILEIARRALPAVPPGGICVADVDAIVEGHLAAAERGRIGERYILGGENLSYREIAATITAVVGRRAPSRTIPRWMIPPAASILDIINQVSGRTPLASGDQIRLSAFSAFFDSSKAQRELAYPLLPFRGAVEKAFRWYREHGYLQQYIP